MSNFTMNTSNDNDGWKTVGDGRRWTGGGGGGAAAGGSRSWGSAFSGGRSSGREMPAAFGGGDPHKAERRAAAEAQAAREATAAREKRTAEEKERKRIADATDFASEDFYPALGGSRNSAAKFKPAMNFSKVVSEMAEREEIRRIEEEREAAARAAAAAQARADKAAYGRHIYGRRTVQQFAYAGDDEDAPADDYPEDSDYEEEEAAPPPPADGEDEEDTGEFNANISSGRRRGDKGIW